MSFLDNLENNLKTLESRDDGVDDTRRREKDRGRALAVGPWAERLKREPYAQTLMRDATIAGRSRRTKVNLAWIDTTLRLEARGHRLELRPTPEGVRAVFLHEGKDIADEPVDLAGDPAKLTNKWMAILDEQKRIDEARAQALEFED
ncbi:MAG TPA: hypothetical protein VK789_16940 [Bryobacteraceae bacterium]|nr:hypothetical protein [Bryobacteraceae bacterium]